MNKTKLSVALAALMLSSPAFAQEKLDKIDVNDVRGMKTYDVYSEPQSFKNNTQVFEREDFQNMPVRNAYEMLDYATGAFIQTQGRKSPYFASVRAGSNLGIIIDGAYLPAPAASKVLMRLPVTAIESMTIVRDASALNLGPLTSIVGPMTSSRTEGFIVIKTLSAFKKPKTELHTRLASHGEVGIDGTASTHLSENIAVRGVLGTERRDGAPGYVNGHENLAGVWKMEGYHDKMDWQVNFFHADGEQKLQRGQTTSGVQDSKWSYDPMSLRMINSQAGYHWNEQNSTAARFSYSESNADLQQYDYTKPAFYKEEKTIERFSNLDLSHAYKNGGNMLRLGYNWMHYHNPTGMLYYPGFERKETIQSLYLQDEYRADRFSLDFGLRTDLRKIDVGYEDTFKIIGGQKKPFKNITKNVELDPLITAAIGGSYRVTNASLLTLRTLYTEQQPVSVYTSNNSSLPKEKRLRLELGWQQSWHELFSTTLTGFQEKLEDAAYIASQTPDPTSPGEFLNVYGSAGWENQGVELEMRGKKGPYGYLVGLSYVEPGKTPTGVVNLPKELVRAQLYYHGSQWTADFGARSMDKYLSANKAGTGTAGGFVTFDSSVGRNFKAMNAEHKISVFAKNFTDEKFETVYGFPSEGATFGVDYRVAF